MRRELVSVVAVLCMSGFLMAAQNDRDQRECHEQKGKEMKICKEMPNRPFMENNDFGENKLFIIAKKLDLSKDQEKALKKVKAESEKVLIPLAIDQKMARDDMEEALMKPNLDEDKIQHLERNILNNTKKGLEARIESVKAARAVLTDEQLKKLADLPDKKNNWKKTKDEVKDPGKEEFMKKKNAVTN